MKTNNNAEKVKKLPAKVVSGNDIPIKNMGILDHIEQIVEISKKENIDICLSTGKMAGGK